MYRFYEDKHLHTLDGKALTGTTTALEIISKPLTWWASGQACGRLGWVNPKNNGKEAVLQAASKGLEEIKGLSEAQYVALLNEAYRAHNTKKEKAAVDGTDMHGELEIYATDCLKLNNGIPMDSPFYSEKIRPFIEWALKNIKQFLWSEIYMYSRRLWTGGISDLGYLSVLDRVVLGDFKSSKDAYFGNFAQAGGYDIQLSENGGLTALGEKVFELPKAVDEYAIFTFGDGFKVRIETETQKYKDAFEAALKLYKAKQFFDGDKYDFR